MSLARQETYLSPFSARYASQEMSHLFSAQYKFSTFRKLWTALAKAQKELGLSITSQQIAEMQAHIQSIDFAVVETYEKKFRHDVMAHIYAYGEQCPHAKPIIHLGATSSFVADNTDLIQLKEALKLLLSKTIQNIRHLATFASAHSSAPCLAYTHFQPAQPTTIGKRACLWLQDLLLDAQEIERHIQTLPFFGAKGATGTAASFLALFDHDEAKVLKLELLIAKEFHFHKILPIAGQTYTRKIDLNILNTLASLAATTHKIATDIRLLSHTGELFETPSPTQIGSSAMPYKKNPIYSERICGLSRFVISLAQNPAYTAATQWLERSLDDSSNRRLSIPEAFLGIDSVLNTLFHLTTHLTPDLPRALANLEANIPHLAMENSLMLAVKKGRDRQAVHEQLRQLSTKTFAEIAKELDIPLSSIQPEALIGRAPSQVHTFLRDEVDPFLSQHKDAQAKIPPVEI